MLDSLLNSEVGMRAIFLVVLVGCSLNEEEMTTGDVDAGVEPTPDAPGVLMDRTYVATWECVSPMCEISNVARAAIIRTHADGTVEFMADNSLDGEPDYTIWAAEVDAAGACLAISDSTIPGGAVTPDSVMLAATFCPGASPAATVTVDLPDSDEEWRLVSML